MFSNDRHSATKNIDKHVYTRCFATISRFAVPYSSCMLWLSHKTSTTRKFLYTPKALAINSLF